MKCVRKCYCELLKSAEERSHHVTCPGNGHKSKLKTVFLIFIRNFRWNFPWQRLSCFSSWFFTKLSSSTLQANGRRQNGKLVGGSESQSQSSICSTPGQSSASNKISSDWPDPPDIPICSTEDEAASIYSDSGEQLRTSSQLQFLMRKLFNDKENKFVITTLFPTDDVIPYPGLDITDGRGTYVIRKGRRRQRIDEYGSAASMSSVNSKLSKEALCESSSPALNVPSPVFPPSMMMPNSRHSIDLGASPRHQPVPYPFHQQQQPSIVNSPRLADRPASSSSTFRSFLLSSTPNRSRLSLDLSSPVITNSVIDQKTAHTPTNSSTPTTKSPSVTKLNTPTSPLVANSGPFPSRYTEFKTYSSTFDGLQALETHNGAASATNAITRAAPQANSSPDNPLMRVSSLPAIAPQNQLAGNYECTSLSLMKAQLVISKLKHRLMAWLFSFPPFSGNGFENSVRGENIRPFRIS